MTGTLDWRGPVGDVWAAEWQRTDRGFAAMSQHLDAAIAAAAPEHGCAIDVGCGAGATSIALAQARRELHVTGIDLSAALVEIARGRAANCTNVSFRVADMLATHDLDGTADVIFSRHGVMFFDDPVAGMAALRRAARPGAALVFSCFDSITRNRFAADPIAAVTGLEPSPAAHYAPGPFGFADPVFVAQTLAAAGWGRLRHEAVPFNYRVGAGDDPVGDAVDFFKRIGPAAPILRAAGADERPAMLGRLADLVSRRLEAGVVDFAAVAWLWSAQAI